MENSLSSANKKAILKEINYIVIRKGGVGKPELYKFPKPIPVIYASVIINKKPVFYQIKAL